MKQCWILYEQKEKIPQKNIEKKKKIFHICRCGKSIFDYKYLDEFKAKIAKVTLVLGVTAVPIYSKNIEKSVSLPCLFKFAPIRTLPVFSRCKWQHLLLSCIVSINLVLYILISRRCCIAVLTRNKNLSFMALYICKKLANPRRAWEHSQFYYMFLVLMLPSY
jgi:hypothetical protein